ncbi:MAG: hypothetical protein CM15mP32_3510 [Flavobacteriaceae bacterium]|nr:MAG: hypothetical protein CM15mP32_3510 [Flavobacteriaceae bacterium]
MMMYFVSSHAQTDSVPMVILPGEKTPQPSIGLDEVIVYQPVQLTSYEEMKKYMLLRRRTLKVYPYAEMASKRFTTLKERLERMDNRLKKKRYAKLIEKYLEGEFKEELKKLTRAEGQILVKLVHRETGITTHELVKTYRNGFRAATYQFTAKLFDIDLKTEFDPTRVEEDLWIEDILLRNGLTSAYFEEISSEE